LSRLDGPERTAWWITANDFGLKVELAAARRSVVGWEAPARPNDKCSVVLGLELLGVGHHSGVVVARRPLG
jgi:hypothetical protein